MNKMLKKITEKTRFTEILQDEKAVEKLFNEGLFCIGCPMASQETIEDGCLSHGMSKKEIDELIKKLNEK